MLQVMKRTSENFLLVHSELQLIQQSADALGNICKVISSKTTNNVERTLLEFLKNPTHRILIISERAFLRISDLTLLKKWKIVLDDVVNFHQYKVINTLKKEVIHKKLFTNFSDLDQKYCTAELTRLFDDDVLNEIYKIFEFIDLYDEFRMNSNFFATKIQNGNETYCNDCNQLSIMAWVDVKKYIDAGLNMTFMANKFTESLLYRSNPTMFTKSLINLRQRKVAVNKRLKVYYFLEKKRFSNTYRTENPNALANIAHYIQKSISGQYYYTANKNNANDMQKILSSGQYISPNSRGMNMFQHFTTAVWLASMKPSPVEVVMCREYFGISGKDLIQAREYENLYQFINRSNLRDYDSDSEIVIYVIDREQAESLGTMNMHHIDLGLENDNSVSSPLGRPIIYSDEDKALRKAFSTYMSNRKDKKPLSIKQFDKWCNKRSLTETQISMLRDMLNK